MFVCKRPIVKCWSNPLAVEAGVEWFIANKSKGGGEYLVTYASKLIISHNFAKPGESAGACFEARLLVDKGGWLERYPLTSGRALLHLRLTLLFVFTIQLNKTLSLTWIGLERKPLIYSQKLCETRESIKT